MSKNTKIIIGMSALIFVVGLLIAQNSTVTSENKGKDVQQSDAQKVTLYKSPSCGCCVNYVSYLKKEGFDVDVITTNDTSAIKREHNIPMAMQSCHTVVVGDYFVEGHMPIEAIHKMMEEKPDIDGIALPGMPSGSPGMPGIKRGMFDIYSVKDGEMSSFTTL